MTAVANPPSFQQNGRSAWSANVSQGGLNAMNADEVARMFMPRKSAQRANSSSSIASASSTSSTSSTATIPQTSPQLNGVPMQASGDINWATGTRKKAQRTGPWPAGKAEPISGVSSARPQSILTTNGASTTPTMTSIHQPSAILPSQHLLQTPSQQMNGSRPPAQPMGEGNPVLYLLSMNGTFERKTISVPYYPDSLRIGRQTNAKTAPTPANGFFDSKVLSRQHAEIWADRQGKIWIRDVKSSNGTFVNGSRLSAENRDSEPHELQTQDHLELGIDIVSEDQKTVVHHKVAAKVEHAGHLGATNNVLDMNFGDLDPANGALMTSQGSIQMRGRSSSQGSVGSNGRLGPSTSVAGSQMSAMGQQRPMNFWLTPVTTEQIVKRLTHEMRVARLQTNDLGRTDSFFSSLMSKDEIKGKEKEKSPVADPPKPAHMNGTSLSFRNDSKPRFSDPPAPPPQQPLPEKPDVSRAHGFEQSSPSLKRTSTERPRSITSMSPVRQEPTGQLFTLVEALASAKKEIDILSAKVREQEEKLQKEIQAREFAEETAKRLESQSESKTSDDDSTTETGGSVIEEAFEPPSEAVDIQDKESPATSAVDGRIDPNVITNSSLMLEKKLEIMLAEMQSMKFQMDAFKLRAETAESERDADRKTLAEMVEKIRSEQAARSASTDRARSPSVSRQTVLRSLNGKAGNLKDGLLGVTGRSNGSADADAKIPDLSNMGILSRPPGTHGPVLYHTTPYASMLGVVILGMGLMAYLNGWQPPKVDR